MKKTTSLLASLLLSAGLLSVTPFALAEQGKGVENIKDGATHENCETHGKPGAKKEECDTKHGKKAKDCDHNKEGDEAKHGGSAEHHAGANPHAGGMGGHAMGMGGYDLNMMMRSPKIERVRALALSDDQDKKVNQLSDELRDNNWNTMGEVMKRGGKLRDLYAADVRDADAIDAVYKDIFDAQRKIIVEIVRTENKVYEVLTPEQKKLLSGDHPMMKKMH